MTTATPQPVLGIIAGGGDLPVKLARACADQQRPYYVLAMEGAADKAALTDMPHVAVSLGAVGEALQHLRGANVEEIVLAGNIKRPSMKSLKMDAEGAKLMKRVGLKLFGGDDAILKVLIEFLEEEGFRVIGTEQVLGGLLAPEGVLTKAQPSEQAREDIIVGQKVVSTLGALDVGQAAIVENSYVLGVEAAEGTDALIKRCASLQREKGAAILIKMKKPGQEERADLPTIGPKTLQSLKEANMAGVAIQSGGCQILEKEACVTFADENGLFIVGI